VGRVRSRCHRRLKPYATLSSAWRCGESQNARPVAFFRNDRTSARQLPEESVVEAREIDDRWCLADALGTLSSILPLVGEIELADQASSETLAIARDARDEQETRMALFGIALTGGTAADRVRARSCRRGRARRGRSHHRVVDA